MPPTAKRVLIVGAGPAGLTAAAELVALGHRVTILEQDEAYVGGISRTVRYKEFRFDIGGHRFFSKNPEIVAWWYDRLPGDFLTVKRQSRILYRGKLFDYPLRPANALRNLGLFASVACVFSYAWRRLFPKREERTFEDWVGNRFGPKLFDIFFRTYTEKVWGIPCSQISADWAAQRIKGLSLKEAILQSLRGRGSDGEIIKTLIDEFQYPRLGPGMMWEKTRDDLLAAGVEIHMGRKVQEIHRDDKSIRRVRTISTRGAHEAWSADEFILSMPLRDAALAMRPSLPEQAITAAQQLKYRDFITVSLVVQGEKLFPDTWIYIHDPGVQVGRVQNFNNWSPELVPRAGVTCLGMEYFCNVGDPLWSLTDDELIALASREALKISLIPANSVVDGCVARMEKTYPVYDEAYQDHVSVIRAEFVQLANLQVVGRNGMHKYNNQDHAMLTGILAARNLDGGDYDLWQVNTDAEYHEAGSSPAAGRLVPSRLPESKIVCETAVSPS